MNKKIIFAGLFGILASGFVFGMVVFATQRTAASGDLKSAEYPSASLEPKTIAISGASSGIPETEAFQALFSAQTDPHSVIHEVKPGDNLTVIAKKYGTTIDLLTRMNHLSSDRLMPGMALKVPTYKFGAVVDKSQNILILKGDEEVLKTYVVSTGSDNSTPAGIFKVTQKLVNPTWYKAGAVVPYGSPENVLGTRWLGISKQGYGIHGTTEPEKLGQQVTAGCIRMKNEEVEELYAFLIPGSEVTVVD